ncbi:MAG: molybdopterin-guanine dinucleotide biosynthesis protein A [Paracoccaceae bacterium]|jgi:molybdopterin-guanine dinucleotide biosynthesis protein A
MKPLGVILAGGQARRMGGGDKAMLMLCGQTLMHQVIERLAPQVAEIAINANGNASRFNEFSLPVIADSIIDFAGPLAGVLAGLDWAAAKGASHIVTVAADTPFFPTDLVQKLTGEGSCIVLAATPDPKRGLSRHPTFGLWPVDLREDLRAALADGTRKVVDWADRHNSTTAEFSIDPFDPFFNVNRPEDMVTAELMLKGINL